MGNLQGKYHVIIDGHSYVLGRNRNGLPYYSKKKAPSFVNKFGSGDSSYRDATFWQFFAQTNWRNGSQQLKFDDPGKSWKSENINVNQLEQISLSKELASTGQTAAGSNVLTIASWRGGSGESAFGDGGDGPLTISADTTETPVDASCSGTISTTSLSATNVSFATGQKILIHQSRGTGAGNYEINEISAYTAGTITTTTPLIYTYTDSGASQAQVRVLKQYSSVTIDSTKTYTAKAWTGDVGGIIGWLCNGTTTITGSVNATGKGYCNDGEGATSPWGYQGEGTTGAGASSALANAANGNGGGAGVDTANRAAGGGGNGTAGTQGGNTGGDGGSAVGSASLATLHFGGEGGGTGGNTDYPGGYGGNGGGIICIFSKTFTITGSVVSGGDVGTVNVGGASPNQGAGGGGGAGGSVLVKAQTATLGSSLITAPAGAGGNSNYCADGGAGGVGRIHLDYYTSYSGTTTPTLDITQDSTLADTPAASEFTGYAGTSTGKIFSWNGGTTWTEVFDSRKLTWYEAGGDDFMGIGDFAGVEYAETQSFQIPSTLMVKGVQVYLKKFAGTPGDITVRIETDNTGSPSGTLANASATATITAFTETSLAWKEVSFSSAFSLTASTTYWLILKTAAAANDTNYVWQADITSGAYSGGSVKQSNNGGSTWGTAFTTYDFYFRILGEATSVNCSLVTTVGATQKILFGIGNPSSVIDGDARIISFDGTNWAINKIFTTASQVTALEEFNDSGTNKVFAGVGPNAIIYESTDISTYTSAKDITKPQNPGYIWSLKEYNRYLYALGGSPEELPSQHYNGFAYVYDTTEWNNLYPFDFTTLRSAEFYDAYLFMGTYHGQLFVYDTASLNPIFDFNQLYEYEVTIRCLKYYDDKLYIGLIPQESSGESNVGIWVYDRHGLSLAYHNSSATGYYCMTQVNNELLIGSSDGYVYKIKNSTYQSSGYYQSSYFDANLPSINKLYNGVEIKHDPLPADTTVVVYYRFKESDSWTTLGTSSTDNAESAAFSFATGTYSKKISIKVELTTSGDQDESPKVTEVIMKYSLMPETKWKWDFRVLAKESLKLRDRTESADNAATIRSNLETSLAGTQLVTFTDVDAVDYTVLLNDAEQSQWVINPDTANEDMISVSLIEA